MKRFLAVFLLVLVALPLLASDATGGAAVKEFPWLILIPPIVNALLVFLKQVWPNMPSWVPVVLAPLAGVGLGQVADQTGLSGTASTMLDGALGATAVWSHQLGKQTGLLKGSVQDENNARTGSV